MLSISNLTSIVFNISETSLDNVSNIDNDNDNYDHRYKINSEFDLKMDKSTVIGSNGSYSDTSSSFAENLGDMLTMYYTPALVCVGSVGNILSVLVFFRTKLRKLSSSYYLAALGISDTCFLIGLMVSWLNFVDINIYNRDNYCQFFTYFSGLCSFLSVWFVVAFTVERFIAVLYPLKRQTMCTVRRAKFVLIGLLILGCIISTPYIFYSAPQYSEDLEDYICDVREEYKYQMTIFNYIDTLIVFIIPFTVIVVLNTFTALEVLKVAGLRRTMTIQNRHLQIHCRNRHRFHQCFHYNGNVSTKTCPNHSKIFSNSSQIKVTKMLLLVSSVFVCLNLPSYVMRVKIYIETEVSKTTIIVQYYCWLFFITNFGINFILYCVSGQNFRKAVVEMFRKESKQRQQDATQVTTSDYARSSTTFNTSTRKRQLTRVESSIDFRDNEILKKLMINSSHQDYKFPKSQA